MEAAWYSAEFDRQFGHFVVELSTGKLAKATARNRNPTHQPEWPDSFALGPIKRVVRFEWNQSTIDTWLR